MSRRNTTKWNPEKWQTKDWTVNRPTKGGYYAPIYKSLVFSDAWHDLSPKAQALYMCCCLQRELQKRDPPLPDNKNSFTMSRHEYRDVFRLYKQSGSGSFIKNMRELMEKGFVKEEYISGSTTREKNIYEMSDRWQQYISPPPKEDGRKNNISPKVRQMQKESEQLPSE